MHFTLSENPKEGVTSHRNQVWLLISLISTQRCAYQIQLYISIIYNTKFLATRFKIVRKPVRNALGNLWVNMSLLLDFSLLNLVLT